MTLYRSCVDQCAIDFCFGRETDFDQMNMTSRSTCHVPAEAVNAHARCVRAFVLPDCLVRTGVTHSTLWSPSPPKPRRATDDTQTWEQGTHLAVVRHWDFYLIVAVLVATAKPDSGRQKDLEVISPGLGVSGQNLRKSA